MDRRALLFGTGALIIAVGFGAFGAHAMKTRLTPEALAQWKTAVEYQFYHGLGLVFLAALSQHLPAKRVRAVRSLFLVGILLFCGSIYLLSTRELFHLQGWTLFLGPMTPVGGLLFIAGWFVLFITAIQQRAGD